MKNQAKTKVEETNVTEIESASLALVPEIAEEVYVNFMTFNIMAKDAFDNEVAEIATNFKEKVDRVTVLSQHAILHFHKTGDDHYVNKLIARLPNGVDIFALKTWFKAFSPLVFDAKTKRYVKDRSTDANPILVTDPENPNQESMEKATALLVKAWQKPWHDFSIKKDPVVPDFDAYLISRITAIITGFEKLETKRKGETPETELQDVMATLKGLKEKLAA